MAVIFWDFDGTLVYSNPLWSNSAYNALKEIDKNTDVAFADIRKCMACGFTWHTPEMDYSKLIGDKWWEFMTDKIYRDYLSLGVKDDIAKRASVGVRRIIKRTDNYTLYPDTVETLEKSLAIGNTNAVLSNNYPDLIDVLNGLGLTEYFDNIFVSANVGYDKPRKEIFDIAKSFYPNDEYIMVGDSITADIIGGKSAGMKTVLVHKGYDKEADFCFDKLTDVFSV